LAIPAALLGTVGIAAFYRGMAIGTISVVAPIAAMGAAIPVAAGVALGDEISALQAAGFALALGGVVLASVEPSELGRARLAAGVPWGVLAAVGFGGYFVPMHEASEEQFLWAALLFRATALVLVLAAVAVVRPPFENVRANVGAILVLGVLDSGGNLLFAAASSYGAVSVTSVLASLYPVVTVALAWAYLRERVGVPQTLGVAGALAGVGLITAG
jgi:drug/metabolite transporter (DMT)-like permease